MGISISEDQKLWLLIGAQLFLLFFMLYMVSLGDTKSAVITMFIGYPLLSGWIDSYYRPVMMRSRVAVYPVFMIIGIFAVSRSWDLLVLFLVWCSLHSR